MSKSITWWGLAICAVWTSIVSATEWQLQPASQNAYFTIGDVEIRAIDEAELGPGPIELHTYVNDCTDLPDEAGRHLWPFASTPAIPGLSVTEIVRIGMDVWKVIEANQPVSNVQSLTASALPRGVKCWNELEQWEPPTSRVFEAVYTNLFQIEVVRFQFRLIYTHGGQKDGRGHYIANATIVPANMKVAWGYKLDAEVTAGNAINLGTMINPVAGLELALRWKISTVINHVEQTANFFLQGDGALKQLNVQ